MLAKSVCIMLSAKAGVGKSTAGKILKDCVEEMGYTAITAPFARRVKQVAQQSFGWDGLKNELGRRLLQGVGQLGRAYNENIWADYLLEHYIPSGSKYPYDFVIIDDWRFPNEEYRVRENPLYSVYTIRLEAPSREVLKGRPEYNDVSEVSLDDKLDFDFVINNEGSAELLEAELLNVIENILSKEKHFGGKSRWKSS